MNNNDKKNIRYDNNGNEIYWEDSYNNKYWMEYDENNNDIYWKCILNNKDNEIYESWSEYDENNNLIHIKDSRDKEIFLGYSKLGMRYITEQEFKQIERRKLFFNNKKINRFEIMDI